eukprot:14283345-Alexandrium_andersonii.AAC.1
MCNLGERDVESADLCSLGGPGDQGGSELSDAGPGSEEAEEGRESKVARDPAARTDEERARGTSAL